MKKFVLKLDLANAGEKRRAFKTVSSLPGIDEIAMDVKAKKLTVIGTVDPVSVVSKLRRKNWPTEIISVGPAKELEKPGEQKKEEAKKDETKKEDAKKDETKKEEANKEPKKDDKKTNPDAALAVAMPYRMYYQPPPNTYYYVQHSMEENPNACAIC